MDNPKVLMIAKKTAVVILLLFVGFGIGWRVKDIGASGGEAKYGTLLEKPSQAPAFLSKDVKFSLFWEVWDKIKNRYVDQTATGDSKLFYGALSGMVQSLGDPYTVFLDPQEANRFGDDLSGSFEGIGAELGMKKGNLTVVTPLIGSPAEKAGLKAGDVIIGIDGKDAFGIPLDQAIFSIRGRAGTVVKLTVARETEPKPVEISIRRSKIMIESAKLDDMDNGIVKIEINHFNKDTADKFSQLVMKRLEREKPNGIILDLRNDPGGFLEVAVQIAGWWVGNRLVVTEAANPSDQEAPRRDYQAGGNGILKDIPLVVLVNEGSASASEILAGALQDYGLATLVGMKTFGKGSVQMMEPLSDGSAVKLTIAKWLTPNGKSIDQQGIMPDVEVKLPDNFDKAKDSDPQVGKAVEILTVKAK
ncbi:MAG: S41 family peptidase [bacterium]